MMRGMKKHPTISRMLCIIGKSDIHSQVYIIYIYIYILYIGRKIRFIYHLQTHTYWSGWITLLVWIYIFLTFFEPTHSESRPFSQLDDSWWICITTEFSVLLFFTFDAILEIIHRKHDNERPTSKHFWKNCKFIFKYFVDVNLLIDAILFWIFYEHGIPYFRYGRLLRPLKLITLSRELRRFSKAIMQTLPYIIDVVILFILVCFIFAILGVKILEDVQGDMKEGELRVKTSIYIYIYIYIGREQLFNNWESYKHTVDINYIRELPRCYAPLCGYFPILFPLFLPLYIYFFDIFVTHTCMHCL